jgi:integrase
MREAEATDGSSIRKTLQYRNGLMITVLALLPLRLKNFVSLEIGRNFLQVGANWQVVIPASETKTRRADERRVPELLAPFVNRYLERHRPALQPQSPHLWIGQSGQPLGYPGCERVVTETTRRRLGITVSPHLFRACAASMVYLHAGDQPHLAAGILQHTHSKVTEAHYNRARGASFANAFSDLVERQVKSP